MLCIASNRNRNPHTYIEKPTRPKSLFGADFGSEELGHCSSKMSKERPLQSMAIVSGPCWTNFCSQKLKRRILATFGFNRTALRVTSPKLKSHYQPQNWCCLANSELRFDTVGLLFVGCRQRCPYWRWVFLSVYLNHMGVVDDDECWVWKTEGSK